MRRGASSKSTSFTAGRKRSNFGLILIQSVFSSSGSLPSARLRREIGERRSPRSMTFGLLASSSWRDSFFRPAARQIRFGFGGASVGVLPALASFQPRLWQSTEHHR